MNITEKNNVAVLQSDKLLITDSQSALDLAMTVQYETQCNQIIINKDNIHEDFFKLSTGLLGDVLQKYVNYRIRLAVVGDFSVYTSKPLHDFIGESNKGNSFFFVVSEHEAMARLTKSSSSF